MSHLHLQPESHLVNRIGWLRAAVLGANDGIISTASLIVGVAAAATVQNAVLIAGVAGLANVIEACKRAQAKLIFFDNVYMYGKVDGLMTEDTPYAPCSKKGEIRAKIATSLMNEVKAGGLSAMIARSADFYGPDTQNGVPNVLVFEAFAKGSRASWLVNAAVPHSLTFTSDAARGLALLAERASTWNQVWHLPT